jgi:hypothetical protein
VSSAADEWDVTVPADGEEFLAELRRHGVRPGQCLHVTPLADAEFAHEVRRTEQR